MPAMVSYPRRLTSGQDHLLSQPDISCANDEVDRNRWQNGAL